MTGSKPPFGKRHRLTLAKGRIAPETSSEPRSAMRLGQLIAVVDDEESVRRALVRLFDSADIEAVAFPSAQAFLRALENQRFDCLVLDLQMPEMTGLDLQRYLRMVRPNLLLPAIMVTAHDEPGVRELCFAAGVGAYLRKPVEGDALLAAVAKLTTGDDPGFH